MPGACRFCVIGAFVSLCAAPLQAAPDPLTPSGDSTQALPGIGAVPVAGALPAGVLGLAVSGGYGRSGAVFGANDVHHRLAGRLAVSYAVANWIGLGLVLDGRYDRHRGNNLDDDGFGGDPRLLMRLGHTFDNRLRMGLQTVVWLPSAQRPPSLRVAATTLDIGLLAAYDTASGDVLFALQGGFRWDRSARALDDPASLSRPDRLTLGLSDKRAVLLGTGVAITLGYLGNETAGRLELLSDWGWDALVGSGASAMDGPMHVGSGLRFTPDSLGYSQWQLWGQFSPRRIPPLDPARLLPYEPELAVWFGVNLRFGSLSPAGRLPASVRNDAPLLVKRRRALSGRVYGGENLALQGARVSLTAPPPVAQTETDGEGNFSFADRAYGPITLRIEAEGYIPLVRTTTLAALTPVDLGIVLAALPRQGQLRGVVRGFGGEPIRAEVRIAPIARSLWAGDDGSFLLEVPPGDYQVLVRARGYVEQNRRVRVEDRGVTVLNVDLRRRRR